jgi:replicative DNA helicase
MRRLKLNNVLVDLQAERAVLSGVFAHGSKGFDEVRDIVDTNTFTDELHQVIFNCCEYHIKDNVDVVLDYPSFIASATALGHADLFMRGKADNNAKLLRTIMNFPIELSNVRKLAARIKKLEIGRILDRELNGAQKQIRTITGDEPIDFILSLAENPIFDLTTSLSGRQNTGPVLMGEGVKDYVQYLINNPVEMVGISTGNPLYDEAIGGGLRRGTVNFIGARPKVGKTTHCDNAALHIAGKTRIPVLNIDTEMTKQKHRCRILANLSGVDIKEIETGKFGKHPTKVEKVNKAADLLASMPYYYESVVGMEFEDILGIMRRWIRRVVGQDQSTGATNPCVIIFDYFQLMNGDGLSNKNVQEYQLLGFQIKALHNFMVRHDVPSLAYIQLNRDGITKEETDIVSGSDRQVWTCSSLGILKKKGEEEIAEDNSGNRKVVILVTRDGPGLEDGDYINMKFNGNINRLTEGKTRNQIQAKKSQKSEGFVTDVRADEQIAFSQ